MIGFLDGLLWGLIDVLFKMATAKSAPKWRTTFKLDQRVLAVSIIGPAALLGMQLGILAGIVGAVSCGLVNAVVGATAWFWIRSESDRIVFPGRCPGLDCFGLSGHVTA